MAKNKIVPKIEKGILLVIERSDIDDFCNASQFSDELKNTITKIADKCFKAKADAVLFLLNYINYNYLLPVFTGCCYYFAFYKFFYFL